MGLARERTALSSFGLPPDVVETIQGSRAGSTRAAYEARWNIFETWCCDQSPPVTAFAAPVRSVLIFLQDKLNQGLTFSTVKVYLGAISACHEGFDGKSVGKHPLVCRFMSGAKRARPVTRALFPAWDLEVVLGALCRPPFEPLGSADLKILSLKTVLLVALTTAKRVSDMHALSVSAECMRFSDDGKRVLIKPHLAFVPKNLVVAHAPVELVAFHPPPFSSTEDERLHCLCPVRALRFYCQRTATVRSSPQLFISYGQGQLRSAVAKATLSRWIVDAIKLAYTSSGAPVPEGLKAHSTRGISASWALSRGASVQEICAAANWVSPSTFATFYCLDVAASSVAHAVLGVAATSTGE